MNLNEMYYVEIEKHISEAVAELKRKAYAAGYEQGKFDQRMEMAINEVSLLANGDLQSKKAREFLEEQRKKSQQEERDRIVERAKKDIEKIIKRLGLNYVQFVINKEKRTIVALIKRVPSPKVESKGKAKAHPDDCFNVHIGKVIALRRALGLEVPSEYLNAPQPTEARVGDIIRVYYAYKRIDEKKYFEGKVTAIEDWCGDTVYCLDYGDYTLIDENDYIIDDSREDDE